MGKKNQNPKQKDILSTLEDFTSKENWDKFFTLRGTDDSFEWYAEWTQLKSPLLSLLSTSSDAEIVQILVPGCGNSRLSEHLYDEGFRGITNVDFSKVAISDMLRRNVRDRPMMRWRVMDITDMQFSDASFDIIVDKGGLDALMEPEFGPKLGNQYLSEVKRVLKPGGKFICLTLAESHVLGLFFPKFRFGWETTLHCIPQAPSSKPSLNTFMVVSVKEDSCSVGQIVSSFDQSMCCNDEQALGISTALEAENNIRKRCVDESDTVYSLEDLNLGAKCDLKELSPGRRVQFTLGGEGESFFRYRAVVLDSKEQSLPFTYHCGIFLVPKKKRSILCTDFPKCSPRSRVKIHTRKGFKESNEKLKRKITYYGVSLLRASRFFAFVDHERTRSQEWLFFSEEGQWVIVESSNSARLVMILLDSSHANVSLEEIQKDLSPLVKPLEPEKHEDGAQIPFMMAGDGIKHREVVHQVVSKLTGPIIVEDVTYEKVDEHVAAISPSKEPLFRRLVFQRSEGLVQSEALLISESTQLHDTEAKRKKSVSDNKSKKREKQKADQSLINDINNIKTVDHTFLVGTYHTGIVAGFTLIHSYLGSVMSGGGKVETVVIGLGAGLLPTYLHRCMDVLHVEVVELDPVVLTLAKEYFCFCEDEHLKVNVDDGIQFLRNRANSLHNVTDTNRLEETANGIESTLQHGSSVTQKIDIIIVDVDSSDSSSGISCPAPDFLEDTFFTTVRDVLSEQGLFIINLVSRSPSMKRMIISRMKAVFSHLYCLQLEEDVNQVIFALNSFKFNMENISEAATQLEKLLRFINPEGSQSVTNTAMKIKCLKP